jgi:hypothetical protein
MAGMEGFCACHGRKLIVTWLPSSTSSRLLLFSSVLQLQAVASTRCGVVNQQDASCTAAAGSEMLVAHHTRTNVISNAACVDTLTGHNI